MGLIYSNLRVVTTTIIMNEQLSGNRLWRMYLIYNNCKGNIIMNPH